MRMLQLPPACGSDGREALPAAAVGALPTGCPRLPLSSLSPRPPAAPRAVATTAPPSPPPASAVDPRRRSPLLVHVSR